MKQQNRAKSELLSNVSHELRTPLATIKGFIETLLESDVVSDMVQQTEFLKEADRAADHLNFLIQDLLDTSRLDSGKMILEKQACQIWEILDSARKC